jgi:hypothetical protein
MFSMMDAFWDEVPDEMLEKIHADLRDDILRVSGDPGSAEIAATEAAVASVMGLDDDRLDPDAGRDPAAADAPAAHADAAARPPDAAPHFLRARPPSPEQVAAKLLLAQIAAQTEECAGQVERVELAAAALRRRDVDALAETLRRTIADRVMQLDELLRATVLPGGEVHELRELTCAWQLLELRVRVAAAWDPPPSFASFLPSSSSSSSSSSIPSSTSSSSLSSRSTASSSSSRAAVSPPSRSAAAEVAAAGRLFVEDYGVRLPVFKGKAVEEPYVVHLVAPSLGKQLESQLPRAVMRPRVEEESWVRQRGDQQMALENHTAAFEGRAAHFRSLRVAVSTRMIPMSVEFSLLVPDGVESPVAVPESHLISITNESQWSEAAGKLLLRRVFGDAAEAPLAYFINIVHDFFLRASKQDVGVQRALGDGDLQYIHARWFDSSETVSAARASEFWHWFGPIVQMLKYKRHLGKLWIGGMIYGLVSKADCVQLLSPLPIGTFLIRFSETQLGAVAIAYRDDDELDPVKHYLVRPEDVSTHKSLTDHLREKALFRTLLVLNLAESCAELVPKDEAFRLFYSKRKRESAKQGYLNVN